jgi:hypothetical protein
MTPTAIETLARQKYNAVGDTYFSASELMGYMWEASMVLAREAYAIERTYTTDSVADQQEYSYPTYALAIKRVTYDGQKLAQITFREDDALTFNQSDTTATGTPQYFAIWNNTLILRPIPSTADLEIKIYAYAEPQEIDDTSTLEVPTRYHLDIVNFVVCQMFLKDQNTAMADRYQAKWDKAVVDAKRFQAKRKRADGFAVVQDEESLSITLLGTV